MVVFAAMSTAQSLPFALLKAMRPKQWVKNLLLFAGFVFTVNERLGGLAGQLLRDFRAIAAPADVLQRPGVTVLMHTSPRPARRAGQRGGRRAPHHGAGGRRRRPHNARLPQTLTDHVIDPIMLMEKWNP